MRRSPYIFPPAGSGSGGGSGLDWKPLRYAERTAALDADPSSMSPTVVDTGGKWAVTVAAAAGTIIQAMALWRFELPDVDSSVLANGAVLLVRIREMQRLGQDTDSITPCMGLIRGPAGTPEGYMVGGLHRQTSNFLRAYLGGDTAFLTDGGANPGWVSGDAELFGCLQYDTAIYRRLSAHIIGSTDDFTTETFARSQKIVAADYWDSNPSVAVGLARFFDANGPQTISFIPEYAWAVL